MATSTAPSTPTHPPTVQRSFTLPTRLSNPARSPVTPRSPEPDAVETLFVHESGKIVSFSPALSSERLRSSSISSSSPQSDPIGVLSWRSQTERTLAAGLVRIYKVPGSVAFLNSGKIVQAILPKSQCWCVDGETIFVLRIGNNSYYRIELPNNSDHDKRIAEGLRSVLPKILQYETTACPFKRGFYVELPESPVTPKRPWKPKHSPSLLSPAVSPLAKTEKTGPSSADFPKQPTRVTIDAAENLPVTETSARLDNANDSLNQLLEADSPSKDAQKRRVSQLVTNIEGKAILAGANSSSTVRSSEAVQFASTPSGSISAPTDMEARDENPGSCTLPDETPSGEQLNTQSWIENNKHPPVELRDGIGNGSPTESETDGALEDEPKDPSGLRREFEYLATSATSRPLAKARSITAPSALNGNQVSFSNSGRTQPKDIDTLSLTSSIESLESFHSFHSPTSPLAPSPPNSQNSSPRYRQPPLDIQRSRPLKRESSNLTAATSDDDSAVDMSTPPWPGNSPVTPVPRDFLPISAERTPSPPLDQSTPSSQPRSASTSSSIRRRLPRRRPHSPLLSPANIYVPRARLSGGHLTSVILQKTCSLLLGPPVQLVALMLNIAAKFAAGSLTATTFTYNERGQAIPCSWGEDEDDAEGEDDYGISLGGTPETHTALGGSTHEDSNWDID